MSVRNDFVTRRQMHDGSTWEGEGSALPSGPGAANGPGPSGNMSDMASCTLALGCQMHFLSGALLTCGDTIMVVVGGSSCGKSSADQEKGVSKTELIFSIGGISWFWSN